MMVEVASARARRERDKLNQRQAILNAAREIAANEVWSAVTTRRVAKRIAYTPPTIYEHFESKSALLAELAREGYRLLLAELQTARARASGLDQAIRDMAQAYCAFAWTRRELYEVMHGLSGAYIEPEAYRREGETVIAGRQETLLLRWLLTSWMTRYRPGERRNMSSRPSYSGASDAKSYPRALVTRSAEE